MSIGNSTEAAAARASLSDRVRDALAVLDAQQREVDLQRRHGAWFGSAYWIMQRSRG